MARYGGGQGLVYLSTSGSGTASAVISLNNWTLNRDADQIDVTSFLDLNKVTVPGLPNLAGTIAGFWDDTDSKPFTAATSADGCKMYLYPSANILTKYAYGPAWISVSMETPVAGAVTLTGNFSAKGSWGLNF